jgi:ribonuclease HI
VETLRILPSFTNDVKGKAPLCSAPLHNVGQVDDPASEWRLPEQGWAKINVDADWDANSGVAGLGAVARDHTGRVLLSVWKHVAVCASAEEAEVLAMLEGLRLAELHIDKPAIVESDCLRVVQVLTTNTEDRSVCWSLYKEAKDMMIGVPDVQICKIGRSSNKVAHGLAQMGKRELSGLLLGAVPSCVSVLAEHDCINIAI